jgi:hypothetical protein
MARRSGLHVVYLGADLPVADWLRAAEQTRAAVAVIAVVAPRDNDAATEVAAGLRTAFPGLVVAFGGSAADQLPEDVVGRRLPEDLAAATTILRELLSARRTGRSARASRSG